MVHTFEGCGHGNFGDAVNHGSYDVHADWI
jgi:hypothetical protein